MKELTLDDHHQLVRSMLRLLQASPDAASAELIETHISSVILAGEFAYKLKKPVDFGFLDFSTRAQRETFCREELRLNGRLAPQVYLDVVSVGGTVDAPVIGGPGAVIDHAVRMRRFPQDALLSHLAEQGSLPIELMDQLVETIVRFHRQAARAAPGNRFCSTEAVHYPVKENFDQLRPLIQEPASLQQLDRLEHWSMAKYEQLRETFADRGGSGWVRECHGDMHLGNMALIDGELVIFDGIEFSERLRWTDVYGDVAFVAMDLDDRGLPEHANRFLSRYFEHTGDYQSLPLLNFYRVYRAMVRAKIAALRFNQELTAAEAEKTLADYHSYSDLAERYTTPRRPVLCITHGLSGSGKSTVADRIADRFAMLRLRSDVERKRLFGLDPDADSGSAVDGGIYGPEATRATYERLALLAEQALRAGYSVVVDAAFLKRWQRQRFLELAEALESPLLILDMTTPVETLRQRLRDRGRAGTDASEATLEVLEQQIRHREPLTDAELSLRVDTSAGVGALEARLSADDCAPGPG